MTAPQIYLGFPGAAREVLTIYAEVLGGELPCVRTRSLAAMTALPTPLRMEFFIELWPCPAQMRQRVKEASDFKAS